MRIEIKDLGIPLTVTIVAGMSLAQAMGVELPEWAFGVAGAAGISLHRLNLAEVDGEHGWKSHATALAMAVVASLQASGVEVPEWVYGLAGAVGLGTLTSAVNKMK